eukprot:1177713-Prorocentrum_minimum.AAC.4
MPNVLVSVSMQPRATNVAVVDFVKPCRWPARPSPGTSIYLPYTCNESLQQQEGAVLSNCVNKLTNIPTFYTLYSAHPCLSLTLPGLAPTPGRISGPAERSLLGGDPPAGGPGKEAAQRQGTPAWSN